MQNGGSGGDKIYYMAESRKWKNFVCVCFHFLLLQVGSLRLYSEEKSQWGVIILQGMTNEVDYYL